MQEGKKRKIKKRADPNDRQIRPEALDALGAGFVEDVGRCIVPIFTDDNGLPTSVGSGFLLDIGSHQVFVTAAHVLDGAKEGRSYYFYVGPETTRAVAGEAHFSKLPASGSRLDDVVDIAVAILEGGPDELPPFPAVGKLSLPVDRVAVQAAPRKGRHFAFVGFPATKAKVNPVVKDVRSSSCAYLSRSVAAERYPELGLDETFHIVLPFDPKKVVTLDGQPFNFPKLQGVSGAPLWEVQTEAIAEVVVQRDLDDRKLKAWADTLDELPPCIEEKLRPGAPSAHYGSIKNLSLRARNHCMAVML